MTIHITFPGGVRVDANLNGHTVHTDQPKPLGDDSAVAPFDLLLASIATCMGFYALRFCQQRNLSIEGLGLSLTPIRDAEGKRVTNIKVDLQLPHDFPDKYEEAMRRSVDHCAVKRAMLEPPAFDLTLHPAGAGAAR